HKTHFPVLPLTWKFVPPSCRRLTPAAASVQNAAGTARSNSNWRRSSRNCGTGIVVYSRSVDTLRLCDEAFGHAPESGDDHQRNTGDAPSHVAATALEVPASDTQASDGDNRSDDVATPVNDVEDRAFDRGCLLTLYSFVEGWSSSQVLRARSQRGHEVS